MRITAPIILVPSTSFPGRLRPVRGALVLARAFLQSLERVLAYGLPVAKARVIVIPREEGVLRGLRYHENGGTILPYWYEPRSVLWHCSDHTQKSGGASHVSPPWMFDDLLHVNVLFHFWSIHRAPLEFHELLSEGYPILVCVGAPFRCCYPHSRPHAGLLQQALYRTVQGLGGENADRRFDGPTVVGQ